MKRRGFLPVPFWLAVSALAVVVWVESSHGGENLTVQALLIWGTNDPQSSNPKHKAVDERLALKLRSHCRWTNYFEINRQVVSIPAGKTNSVPMSERCKLEVANLGNDRVEVKLYGQGRPVSSHKERVAIDWPLILSGDAKNGTAWFVVIRKLDSDGVSAK
jgi:hypothetical protein